MVSRKVSISGKGQLFSSGELLCQVVYKYVLLHDTDGEPIPTEGQLHVEETKRRLSEIVSGIRRIPVELRLENGDRLEIVILKNIGGWLDGDYMWMPWQGGKFSIK